MQFACLMDEPTTSSSASDVPVCLQTQQVYGQDVLDVKNKSRRFKRYSDILRSSRRQSQAKPDDISMKLTV